MLYKKINVDVYRQTVHVFLCESFASDKDKILSKKLPKLELDTIDFDDFAGICRWRGDNHLILLSKEFGYDRLISTSVHESLHVTNNIMKRVGIISDLNNDEAQAYLLTYIFEQILKTINNKQD